MPSDSHQRPWPGRRDDTGVPAGLHRLRQQFRDNGFDLRLVGGCVRDRLRGLGWGHDIDLCTDADPAEQRALYETYTVRHIDTGRAHGTWSVVLDGTLYEISSLRRDAAGSPSVPHYTRDWDADLARRDLTINAMLMDFEGHVIDPQHGRADLAAGRVRFVGAAATRIQEDPLRILRWFRFHAAIAAGRFAPEDVLTIAAIEHHRRLLAGVSRERIWAEMHRILAEPLGVLALLQMILAGVAPLIDLPVPARTDRAVSLRRLEIAHHHTRDPVSLLAAYLGTTAAATALAEAWRFSSNDARKIRLLADGIDTGLAPLADPLAAAKRRVKVDRVPTGWMIEILLIRGQPEVAEALRAWRGVCPVRGVDLIAAGIAQGPGLGAVLHRLRQAWADSDYTLTHAALLAKL